MCNTPRVSWNLFINFVNSHGYNYLTITSISHKSIANNAQKVCACFFLDCRAMDQHALNIAVISDVLPNNVQSEFRYSL